ncbi:Putative B3 domain-containing protein Os03g0621600 [Linum grandiflorum]
MFLPLLCMQKLPLKFVRRYGSNVSSVAKLSLPNGHAWEVGVEKKRREDGNNEEEIWLSKGWGKFMEHHSISIGFFLVFRYRGHSDFHVEIFNLTTCSISYPQFENVGSSHIVISDEENEKDEKFGGDEIEKTLESLKASGIVTSCFLHRRIRKMYIKCKQGIEDAILVSDSDPAHPSFIIVLNYDESRGRDRPVIPITFAREHVLKGGIITTSVVLQMSSSGKQWSVEVGNNRKVKSDSYFCVSFGQGWRQFHEDNNLGEGDVCLFQLISSPEDDNLVMDVSIFPAQ